MMSKFLSVVEKLYKKARKPFALVVVGSLLAFPYIPDENIKFGLLTVMGFIVLSAIFEIHKQICEPLALKTFANHSEAQPTMGKLLKVSLSKNRETHIKVLGVSLHYSWTFLRNTLRRALADRHVIGKITLEFAYMDDSWDGFGNLKLWHSRLLHTEDEIRHFKEEFARLINSKKLTIRIYRYKHMPNWHGLMVDNTTLFLSYCDWQFFEGLETEGLSGRAPMLTIGQNKYQILRRSDGTEAAESFAHFDNWFEYCKVTSREYQEGAHEGEGEHAAQ